MKAPWADGAVATHRGGNLHRPPPGPCAVRRAAITCGPKPSSLPDPDDRHGAPCVDAGLRGDAMPDHDLPTPGATCWPAGGGDRPGGAPHHCGGARRVDHNVRPAHLRPSHQRHHWSPPRRRLGAPRRYVGGRSRVVGRRRHRGHHGHAGSDDRFRQIRPHRVLRSPTTSMHPAMRSEQAARLQREVVVGQRGRQLLGVASITSTPRARSRSAVRRRRAEHLLGRGGVVHLVELSRRRASRSRAGSRDRGEHHPVVPGQRRQHRQQALLDRRRLQRA